VSKEKVSEIQGRFPGFPDDFFLPIYSIALSPGGLIAKSEMIL